MGFPEGYRDQFKLLYVFDRPDNRQVRVVCGNDVAASVQPGQPFPHGSILAMETWLAKQDASEKMVTDDQGHLIRETLNALFVMRKEPGFGADYLGLRTGEWEYVAYRPDRSHSAPPEHSANCAACHLAAGQARDWAFRTDLFFDPDQYASAPAVGPGEVALNSIAFSPRTLSVKAGATVTWINHDLVAHTVSADDGSFESGPLNPGDRFTFSSPGTFAYHCSVHPEQMKAQVEAGG